MDPKLAELRKAMAARYAQVPADQKPRLRQCPDCNQPVYCKVCPETGMLHDRDKKRIVGGTIVDADQRGLTSAELVAAINAARVKWQTARVSKVKVDGDSLAIFQTFVAQAAWNVMRVGVLYGTYDETERQVYVHTIYEPEQTANNLKVLTIGPDRRQAQVDELAKLLGWRRVGLIMTHPARDPTQVVLTGQELLAVAKEQSLHGDHCVLLSAGPDPTTRQLHAQAWQASEQAVNLYQMGLLSEDPADVRMICSSQPLELSQEDTDERGRRQCIVKEPATTVDTRWLLGYCAVESFKSDVVSSLFVRISRPGQPPPDFNNLRIYLSNPNRLRLPLNEQLADFHVLVFLMENLFDVKTDMPFIVDAIRKKTSLLAYEELLRERLKPSTPPPTAGRR